MPAHALPVRVPLVLFAVRRPLPRDGLCPLQRLVEPLADAFVGALVLLLQEAPQPLSDVAQVMPRLGRSGRLGCPVVGATAEINCERRTVRVW